jgi:hypothetical protein
MTHSSVPVQVETTDREVRDDQDLALDCSRLLLDFCWGGKGRDPRGLTCHVDSGSCPQFSISCDWEEPSDCYTDEPAWDLCEDVCFWNCPAGFMIDYVNSYGSARWEFNCACHIVG